MQRVKKCKNCGNINMPSELFCKECGADISKIDIVFNDENEEEANDVSNEKLVYFKLCSRCAALSLASYTKCMRCGEDLGLDIVECNSIPNEMVNDVFFKDLSDKTLKVKKNGVVQKQMSMGNGLCAFGRSLLDDVVDAFPEHEYVSEIHCLIDNSNDKVEVLDVSTNGSYYSGNRINEKQTILFSDEIDILGRDYFCIIVE